MKKLKIFSFILLLTFLFTSDILAANNIGSETTPNNGTNCTSQGCWPFIVPGNNKALRGMRATLVDSYGKKVKNSSTFNMVRKSNEASVLKEYEGYYYWPSNCSKVEYGAGTCKFSSPVKKTGDQYPYGKILFSNADIATYFDPWGVDLDNLLYSDNMAGIWNKIKAGKNDVDRDSYIKLIARLFFSNNINWMTTIDAKNLNDMFIVIEPLTYIRYEGKDYLGTFYELANIRPDGYANLRSDGNPLTTFLNGVVPCISFITKDKMAPFKGAPGVNLSNNSYFNNARSYSLKAADNNICTSSNMPTNSGYKYSNSGVGVGIIWIEELMKIDGSMSSSVGGPKN